jgi:hypothetical protein
MKLSSLTPEQKNRLLAELDGWKLNVHRGYGHYPPDLNPHTNINQDFKYKDYLTSYDAIIPLVQKLSNPVKKKVEDTLLNDPEDWWFDSSPSQLCDAVLVATGKAEL